MAAKGKRKSTKRKSPAKPPAGRSRKSPAAGASRARRSAPSPPAQKKKGPQAAAPTVKQQRYIAGVIAGKTKRRAATEAGYSPAVASNVKHAVEGSPAVARMFREAMRAAGITPELRAKRMREGMDATTVLRRTFHANREVLVDYSERREMLELIGRFEGDLIDRSEVEAKVTLEQILEGSYE